jgi:CRISPR-associated protein Csd1
VGKAQHNLARWFRLQRLVDWDGQVMDPYGLFPIAASIAPKTKGAPDIPANISRSMMAAALTGAAFTPYLLYQAVRRNQAEQGITRPRAVLIKMALLSQNLFDLKEDDMIELEQTNREPAYLCGRLLAELENIQKEAVPGAKATLVDRFFGTASSAPASVFGNLMRGAQPHLSKLRKEKPKIYAATQTRLEEIQEALPFFPKVLTMQEQGLFSLGYYHQRAAIAAIKRSKINEKNDVGESKKEA